MNELLSIIHYISQIKENLHEKLEMVKYAFLPLLSHPAELIEDLASYINYLFHELPTEAAQCCSRITPLYSGMPLETTQGEKGIINSTSKVQRSINIKVSPTS